MTSTLVVCPAVMVTDAGCEHGSACGFPDPVSMSGERPDTW
jgi:hypothetical protein